MKVTISKKMWFGFSAVLFLLILISALSIFAAQDITGKYKSILEEDVQKINLVGEIEVIQKGMATDLLEYVLFGKEDSVNKFDAEIERGSIAAKTLTSKVSDPESLKLLEDLHTQTVSLFESNDKIIASKKKNQPSEQYVSQSTALNAVVIDILTNLKQIQMDNLDQTKEELDKYQVFENRLIIILTVLSIIIGIVVSYFIGRSISNPIQKVTASLQEIADGNLLVEPILIKNRDEVGVMATTFNKMTSDLQRMVTSVRDSSVQLAANAEELTASSEESLASFQMVAQSASEQMATSEQQVKYLESSVNSMVELQQGVGQISESNAEMLHATDGVKILVKKGSTVVSDVANQMDTIHTTFKETTKIMNNMAKHSAEIQSITALITDISDQTNLLALNAAIEAARAGEYGKGFAVVAEEVRKLAEQSKNSATEITSMVQLIQTASGNAVKAITTGGAKVEEGLSKTTESLHVFHEIESSVEEVVFKVESVSAAIEQIQAKAESVTDSALQVQSLATVAAEGASETSAATEEQLAANEEISTNAQSLADLSEKLKDEVSHFKI